MSKEKNHNEILRESEVTNLNHYLFNQPCWVKQYYLYNLYRPGKYYSKLESKKGILIQELKPQPTSNFYALRKDNFESGLIKLNIHEIVFLECVDIDRNFIEICCDKQWSLTKCCYIYLSLIAKQLIYYPKDRRIIILIEYILKKITLEEYLVRSKRITIKQLDNALYAQKRTLEETGESSLIEEMLIKLDYVKAEEIDDLQQLVSSAEKPCLMENKTFELELQLQKLKDDISRLKVEKMHLREENTNCKELLLQKSVNIVDLTRELNNQKECFSFKKLFSFVFST